MQTTYGLGTNIRGPSGGGMGLSSMGQQQQRTATELLGQQADLETNRNLANRQRADAEKQGKVQLGASVGAMAGAQYGAAGGPWGMLIGGVIGALAGSQL